MRSGIGPIFGRIAAAVGVLLLVGVVLRLLLAILSPVLPPTLNRDLMAGWDMLYGFVAPAMPAVMAAVILGCLVWAIGGRRR